MKIQKIMCDGCGKEIEGDPIKLFAERVDRETGDFITEDNAALYAPDKDFCDECSERIKNFIETMGKPLTEKDEPLNPTVEVVTTEPEPKAKPTETNENQQKPTVKELILQGKSKEEVVKLTGCTEGSYNQIKYTLKKKGLLANIQQNPTLSNNENVKTYKCSEVGHKCFYRTGHGSEVICDYIGVENRRRGCKPEECDKFREK